MKAVAVSVVMGLALGEANDDYYKKEFEKFGIRFGKSYAEKEKLMRYNEFKRTFQLVASHNAKGKPYTMTVNQFADITVAEMKATHMGYSPQMANRTLSKKHLSVDSYSGAPLESSLDWRTKGAVTPMKNQGQCGSCWAFSTIAGMEGAWFVAGHPLQSFSEQQLTDCEPDFQPDGCNGGLTYMALQWEKSQIVCTEASYPYTSGGSGHAGQCQSGCTTGIPIGGVTGYTLVTPNDENALVEALMKQPVSISIDASCDSFMNYHSGTWTDGCGTDIDHAVTAVGFGSGYWIVKNSWGTTWGDQGYIMMQRGVGGEGISGILNAPVYPQVTGGSGPTPGPGPSPGPTPAPTPTPPSPPPSPSPGPSPGGGAYGPPPCPDGEQLASTSSGASFCAPSCDNGVCPPSPGNAQAVCSDNARTNGRICVLTCDQDSDCQSGAICDDTLCAWPSSSVVV